MIIPEHIWADVEDPYTYTGDGYLVGSGAYMCTSYDGPTGSYEFTAFDEFAKRIKNDSLDLLFQED
ncbi:MAG: hypothetical protein SOY73_01990 [Blautia sp.]|nr:hypothetical protein [Blautia sp.]